MTVVAITGGLGFLGSHLAREFLRRGHEVVLIDIATDQKSIGDIEERVRVARGDVSDYNQLEEAIRTHEVEAVVHYAALLSNAAEANPRRAYKVNFNGLWNVFEVARAMDLDSVIFASSIAAYGPGVPQTVKEDVYTIPQTLYGVSKQYGEMLGLWFQRRYGINFAAFRYGSVIGPGRRNGGASGYSTLMIQKPAQGEPFLVNVPEDSMIPMAYVKDVADATIAACERMKGLKTRIYNLASLSPSPTAKDIAEAVVRCIPDAKIAFEPEPQTTQIVESWPRNLDITRAGSELGWKPRYTSLDALVADFIADVRGSFEIFTV